MDMRSEKKKKNRLFKHFLNSLCYSWEGLVYAFRDEPSITIMILITVITVITGFLLKISTIEWLFICLSIGIILATELINTSIEATIDLLSPKVHPLAKVAKDTASAAVFVFSVMAFIIGSIIFIPNIIELIIK
jgi:undecaprenol kinase